MDGVEEAIVEKANGEIHVRDDLKVANTSQACSYGSGL